MQAMGFVLDLYGVRRRLGVAALSPIMGALLVSRKAEFS
jgi:hypothetical protein